MGGGKGEAMVAIHAAGGGFFANAAAPSGTEADIRRVEVLFASSRCIEQEVESRRKLCGIMQCANARLQRHLEI